MSEDLISRQAAIDAILEMNTENRVSWLDCALDTLDALPSADIDLSDYSDRLWRNAYEQGKADAEPERKKGKWIPKLDDIGFTYGECSECGMRNYAGHTNFCPNCGAEMKGEADG